MTTSELVSISKKYKKLEGREHVLTRPGMYIGSIDEDTYETWVFDSVEKKMVKKTIKYVPGLFKIFDEILVNAIDHSVRMKTEKISNPDACLVKSIKITIDKDKGIFEVTNDGNGIEVVKHPVHNIYIPELIFGNLLTSTNYDDEEERIIGGSHGLGSKCSNIFSTFFEVETVDHNKKLLYKQRFEKNMSVILPPTLTKYTKKPYTTIRFQPDYAKLNMPRGFTSDMYDVIIKRVYDACAVTGNDVSIYLNEEKLEYKNFEKYADLYLGEKSNHSRVYEEINDRWEVIATYNNSNGFEQISFVNGVWTIRGGKHVDYITNQIVKKLTELISKKNKTATIKPQSIKDNLMIFVKSTIVNPKFDSQSKETLTTPVAKFGSKGEVSDKFVEKLFKTGIVERVLQLSQVYEVKSLQKSDGKKKNMIRGLPKLEDANWAGTSKSKECLLILTEGDSACSTAISGLAEVGRDRYGVFPLKGKIMNVKDANVQKIADNDEISNIKKILGLESGKVYTQLDDLRYGGIMLLTDQDHDGFHIRGLLMNLFHSLWPSLTKDFQFLHCMQTPIVKVKKGNDVMSFYNLTDFENWRSQNLTGWEIKYYKGLGTSTDEEAKEYFKNMKKCSYKFTEISDSTIDMAFNKKRADDRKSWLGLYDRQRILDYTSNEVTYEDFVNKELIHFSNYDIERSIPNMVDGLKISQRKVLFSCFKRNLTEKEIKVAQLAAYVAEQSAYHHGEVSLQGAIVNMAQDFVGANNINLLKPNGQFGSRLNMGHDSAQPRYIFTLLTKIATTIFKKHDQCVLKYLEDDGQQVEPEYYVPIMPLILVNGALGIGTGFSTTIPCYNPRDIVAVLKRMLAGELVSSTECDLKPWYRGFQGDIRKVNGKWHSIGKYFKSSATKIEVTELPIGYATFDFKADLEAAFDKFPDFKKYENMSAGNRVHFILHFSTQYVVDSFLEGEANGFTKFENTFKLVSSKGLSTTNMYAFNARGQITKYDTTLDIISEFYQVRLDFYRKRKLYILEKLQYDADLMANKIRFIKEVVAETIKVHKMKKAELESYLGANNYMKHENSFEYIVKIPIYNLTMDKVTELEADIAKALGDIEALKNKAEQTIWGEELDEFEKVYDSFIAGTPSATSTPKKKLNKK
jgi:DNA topoisomerase II